MLEIYNETIRDLLSSNKSCSTESSANKQQYAIKHDPNGTTHVSDLTIVDVRSSKEVAFLLNRAAQSRYSILISIKKVVNFIQELDVQTVYNGFVFFCIVGLLVKLK